MDKTEFKTLEELLEYFGNKPMSKMPPVKPLEYKTIKPGQIMNKQEMALDNVRKGVFIVGSIDEQGTISFAPNPMVHADATAARTECKRLAQVRPGKAFTFVKFAGAEMVPTNTISI